LSAPEYNRCRAVIRLVRAGCSKSRSLILPASAAASARPPRSWFGAVYDIAKIA
jgi:hypothetical protein